MLLFADIVSTIGRNGIARFIEVRHGARRFRPRRLCQFERRIRRQPLNVGRAGVRFLMVAESIFTQQFEAEGRQPPIMGEGLTRPLRTRMIHVAGLVATLRRTRSARSGVWKSTHHHPVTGVQELASFQQHLDDVLVAVPARTFAGIRVKKENVHVGRKEGMHVVPTKEVPFGKRLSIFAFYCPRPRSAKAREFIQDANYSTNAS